MADGDDHAKRQPSLELPSLRLRRRRRDRAEPKVEPAAEPASGPASQPVSEPVREPAPSPPTSAAPPAPDAPRVGDAPPLFVDDTGPSTEPLAGPDPAPAVAPADDAVEVESEGARSARRPLGLPRPGGMPAAVLTGVVVGLGIVGLTWAGLRGCEAVQGTSSCGGAGYPLLAAIVALMVVVGALLLRFAHVRDPGTTSILAVGLTAVVALLFLVDSLLDRAMVVVIPVICAVMFAAAHWVTRTFVERARD